MFGTECVKEYKMEVSYNSKCDGSTSFTKMKLLVNGVIMVTLYSANRHSNTELKQ